MTEKKTDYWLYIPEVDEAGCVASGNTPEEALKNAEKVGWFPDPGAEVQTYVLGAGCVIFAPEKCHVCGEVFSDRQRCDCEVV